MAVEHDVPAPNDAECDNAPDARDLSCDGSDLCTELSGSSTSAFSLTYEGDPASRILAKSTNFATVADISPLVEGHLLVAPKVHYFNYASAMQDHRNEAVTVLLDAARWVKATYGMVALFEHGSTHDGVNNACIHHAHVHVLPVSANALSDVMRSDHLGVETFDDIDEWLRIADAHRTYLMCSNGETFAIALPSASVRHQYLRAAAGRVLGIPDPEWDWSVVVRKHLLRATVDRFRSTPSVQDEGSLSTGLG